MPWLHTGVHKLRGNLRQTVDVSINADQVSLDDPVRGEHLALGCPIKIESNKVEITPPPLLGQHSKEVLAELLKMKEDDRAELETRGVI